jgi:hypothetical protein
VRNFVKETKFLKNEGKKSGRHFPNDSVIFVINLDLVMDFLFLVLIKKNPVRVTD